VSQRRYPTAIAVLLAVLTTSSAFAAPSVLPIDLGAIDPGTERVLATSPGEYTISILNRLPAAAYDVEVAVSFVPIEPLEAPGARGAGVAEDAACPELEAATQELLGATSEDLVAANVGAVNEHLDGCAAGEPAHRLALQAIASTREHLPYAYTLASNQRLAVTISRRDGAGRKVWTVVFQTAPRGRWFSSYGFVFVSNDDEQYFSKPTPGAADQFTITRKSDTQDYDFAPSLFYSWLPARREGKALSLGAAAGLGFDQTNPVVFAGPMLTYNQNISLLAGAVMRKRARLDGMYSPGQEVTEDLDEDQLTEESYHPGLFFGLSFRFGANPFATAEGPSEPPAPAEPEPAQPEDPAEP
jgi:hypothetical protein